MLSATITIDEKGSTFINKSGLTEIKNQDRLNTFIGKSPFCYEKQAKMLVIKTCLCPEE